MKNKLLSIIIPVYNGEKYIKTCLESVLKQEDIDVEVIIIDDGSKDRTEEVCKAYLKNSNVKYVRIENSGVSKARNIGITYATGQYITFVDADDFIAHNCYKVIIEKMQENTADLGIFKYEMVYSHEVHKPEAIEVKDIMTINQQDLLSAIILNDNIQGFVWNKIFSRDIIERYHIQFDEQVSATEDTLFNWDYIKYCHKAIYIDAPLYYYFQNKEGCMFSGFNRRRWSSMISFDRMLTYYTKQYMNKEVKIIKTQYALVLALILDNYWRYGKGNDREYEAKAIQTFKMCYSNWPKKKYCLKHKVGMFLMRYFTRLYQHLLSRGRNNDEKQKDINN